MTKKKEEKDEIGKEGGTSIFGEGSSEIFMRRKVSRAVVSEVAAAIIRRYHMEVRM